MVGAWFAMALICSISTTTNAFVSPGVAPKSLLHQSNYNQLQRPSLAAPSPSSRPRQGTELYFMGSDGGILGIGTPELVRQ